MRSVVVLAISASVLMLSGCISYRYGDRTFNDRATAEAAQRADLDIIRMGIKPRKTSIAKSGRVVILSKALLLERGTKEGGLEEARDYVATTLAADMRNTAEAIRSRNIFDKFEIEESSDGAHVTPRNGESVIYFYLPDRNTGGWYYLSATTKRTPLQFDRGNPDKVGKVKYFIDSIEALAAGEPK